MMVNTTFLYINLKEKYFVKTLFSLTKTEQLTPIPNKLFLFNGIVNTFNNYRLK